MKKKIFISAIAVIVVVISVFTACSGDKETTTTTKSNTTLGNEQVSLVRDENGEIVTGEDGKAMTTVVDGVTTAKSNSNDNTTTKQTTTKQTTTKKVTTTKKQTTTKKVTTTKKETTTKKAETTQNIAKPLTASQKQWVLDNWFNKFPEQGAADDFEIFELDDANGTNWSVSLTQGNYKSMVELLSDDTGLSKGCRLVVYYWEDTDTKSILHYKCGK